jgi:hypothetical protein
MKWLHFILSHSIFIAFCAVGLCYQTAVLLHINLSYYFYGFIFFSTVCSYNFYWLLSGFAFAGIPLVSYLKKHYTNLLVFIIAGFGLLYSVTGIINMLPLICAAMLLTLLYAVPLLPFKISIIARKAGIVKTVLLAFTWAFITVYLPYKMAPTGNRFTLLLLFNNRFLFMLMLCIIFDARDTHIDKIRGLQSLTTILSVQTVQRIMAAIFALFILNGIILRIYYHEILQIIALLITGVLVAMVYLFSLKKRGYFFYYFLVDGLMLFSALASYVASI